MADSKQAWDQVGRDLSDLGRRVRQQYQQRPGPEHPAPADRRKVDDALHELRDSLDRAFTALGDAVRDPEFGAQTKKAADSLSDALSATFAEVSERLRSKPGGGQRPPTDS
ncbi:MAG TPA: hypothetical protein VF486_15970 [Actinomycetes bacterium]